MDANHVSFSPTNPFLLRIRIHPQFILFFRSPSPTHSKSIPFGRYKPNRARYFQNAMTETGLSDFHNMEITVMKIYYEKQKSIATYYRKASIIFCCCCCCCCFLLFLKACTEKSKTYLRN